MSIGALGIGLGRIWSQHYAIMTRTRLEKILVEGRRIQISHTRSDAWPRIGVWGRDKGDMLQILLTVRIDHIP